MKQKDEIIEDFQDALINAGGRFFRRKDFEKMNVLEFIDNCFKNGITIEIKNIKSISNGNTSKD